MQRALAYAGMPALRVPLRLLLTAPCFALAAGLLLLWQGEAALVSRWAPATLALTHLMTLGVLATTMAGALLQLLPVVAGLTLPYAGPAGAAIWLGLTAGTAALAGAMLAGVPWLFVPAAILLAGAGVVLLASAGACMFRTPPAGARSMIGGVRLALPAFAVTIAIGAAMARFLGGGPAVPVLLLADVHAAWGLLGWVAMLIVAVAFQVIPMFQSTPLYPPRFERLLPRLLGAALLGWTLAVLTGSRWSAALEAPVAGSLAAFAGYTLYLLQRRTRPAPDATTLYWRLSLGSLLACIALRWLPVDAELRPLLTGVLFIAGFAMSAVNGMLCKIVPFLLWYHLQEGGRLERAAMPNIRTLLPDDAAKRQFRWHAGAVTVLTAACIAPQWVARPAALVACIAAAILLRDMALPVWRYRAALRP